MSRLPKLKVIQPAWDVAEEIRDFEQGKYLPFCGHIFVVVEEQVIWSYEELVELASRDCYKDKKFLKVEVWPILGGG